MAQQFGDQACRALGNILLEHGRSVLRDSALLSSLLRDFCPGGNEENEALLSALNGGIPGELLGTAELPEARFSQLAEQLNRDRGLPRANAEWAVQRWAFALDIKREPAAPVAGTNDAKAALQPTASAKRPAPWISSWPLTAEQKVGNGRLRDCSS